ncbi:efflux transporter outer membrane subunit [Pseudoxanthomonas sp.]|uniref:efflux transporter outer membrane subunit n=1 Tax=Pseudoxanthomonas sp. TaxID=1871049 RepID=UPI0026057899|nr:efflux transporter outer membrane subunit [Pseudoxanthomonas sp.]WDS37754.1 MAG: efflux transporter outer membrane subunit [Pseudoxanthomonas sp.]
MRPLPRPLLATLALALGGCSLAPVYKVPPQALPAHYASAGPAAANPSPDSRWWQRYQDPQLDQLQQQLLQANPTLAAAVAHYDAARAAAGEIASARFPQLDASGSPVRQRQSDRRPLRGTTQPDEYDSNTLTLSLSFDLDLWGRLRNLAAAGHARARASGDDLAAATLSLQQQLTALYLQLRGLQAQGQILEASLDDYRQALALTEHRYQGDIAPELDVVRARHQLASAQAERDDNLAQCELALHALAELVGQPASGFTLAAGSKPTLPQVPLELPSALLQRRPDIAAAERRVFAANAGIGVARAAWFPQLGLSALLGGQTAGSGNLLAAGNRYWALGPVATLPIFDGGKRKALKQGAQAEFDAAAAQYRGVVLHAIRQVEDQLTELRQLALQQVDLQDAVTAATAAEQIARNRYDAGAASYLDVVTAQTDARVAQLALQQVLTRQLQASSALMAALGGGWQDAPAAS